MHDNSSKLLVHQECQTLIITGLDRYGLSSRMTKTVQVLAKPGRPLLRVSLNEEVSAVIGTYKEYPCSAVVLETILDKRHGIKIAHNRIHKILKNFRLCFKRY